jgi:hypothetical protein
MSKNDKFRQTRGLSVFYSSVYVSRDLSAAIAENEAAALRRLIAFMGGWPAIDRQWNSSDFDVTRSIGLVRRILSYTPLFIIYVGADERNSTMNLITVSAG